MARVPGLTRANPAWETSPALMLIMGLFVLADGFLSILALVALGQAVGRIPGALSHGLGSPSGNRLLIGLAIGTTAYALSLLRSPAEALLSAHSSAVMSTGCSAAWRGPSARPPESSTWRTPPSSTSSPRRAASCPRPARPTRRWRWPARSATG
ncbi:MAG: hypothetical protein ACRDOU_17870 [Streptosporangiaceae bacterium]